MSNHITQVTQDFIFGTLATDELRLAALSEQSRGVWHGNRIDPLDPLPGQAVALSVSTGPAVAIDRVTVRYTIDGAEPDDESATIELDPAGVMWDTLLWGYRREWQCQIPGQPDGTLVRYRVVATGADGDDYPVDPNTWNGQSARFAYHVDRHMLPDWVRDAVIYHIFVDRFEPGGGRPWNDAETLNDFWGGTIRGVTERLPELADLGVTCLWLSPIFPSPTHHGYDATDYRSIEPRLGTEADLIALCDAAHEWGMRVILDFVASHVSNEHPALLTAQAEPDSPERGWFSFRKDGTYRSYFGISTMPQINTDDPGARAFLIDAATYWLEQGADGFRLDHAQGPSHSFWSAFRSATRAIKPDSFNFGEVVETAELQRSYLGRLDGTLDFLMLQQMRAFFAFDVTSPAEFDAFLTSHLQFFPEGFVLPSFLDNHDMNRFLWVSRGDVRRLKLAVLCQFTLPYPPIVYYGTEVGLNQWHDLEYPDGSRRSEESRVPMIWGDGADLMLRDFYVALIGLRRNYPTLWSGRRTPIARDASGLYAVAITDEHYRAVVALNRSDAECRLPIGPTDDRHMLVTQDGVISDAGTLILPPMAGAVLVTPRR